MLRGEVQKRLGLTRKAIEYYEDKGLVVPQKDGNGYRRYSDLDIEKLYKINTLRKLGLGLYEIESVLENKDQAGSILRDRQIKSDLDRRKNNLLQRLVAGDSIQAIDRELSVIEQSETMYDRLQGVFPGYYGQCLFYAYKPFLNGPVNKHHEEAFRQYIHYLDFLPALNFSQEEKEWIEKAAVDIDLTTLDQINESKLAAVDAPGQWFADKQEAVKAYLVFKESDEYKQSPISTINDKVRKYMQENDYYEKGVPLIRQFSPMYNEYYNKLLKAEEWLKDKL